MTHNEILSSALTPLVPDKEKIYSVCIAHNTAKSRIKNLLLAATLITMLSLSLLTAFSVIKPSQHKDPEIPHTPISIIETEEASVTENKAPAVESANNITEPNITEEITDVPATNNEDPDPIGGGDVLCPIHTYYYHAFPSIITNYIGQEEFRKWVDPTALVRDKNGCYPEGDILKCVEHFNIPDEVIIEAYQNDFYNCDWDMESLLARDAESFDKISRESRSNPEYNIYRTKLYNERDLKERLFDILKTKTDAKTIEYYNRISDNGTKIPWCEVSIIDIVINTSITKNEFAEVLNPTNQKDENGDIQRFEYNLDLLFGDTETLTKMIDNLEIPYYESRVKMADALLHVGEKSDDHVAY